MATEVEVRQLEVAVGASCATLAAEEVPQTRGIASQLVQAGAERVGGGREGEGRRRERERTMGVPNNESKGGSVGNSGRMR